jgi:hypothetical protein
VRDHGTAFAHYERGKRGFVEQNQALVAEGDALLFPTTVEAPARRDALLRRGSVTPQAAGWPEHSALTFARVRRRGVTGPTLEG